MNLFSITSLACGIFCSVLALITLIYGKSKLHRTLAFFNISVAIWGYGCFWVGISNSEIKALLAWRFAQTGGIFIAVFFYHMVCTFCELKKKLEVTVSYAWGTFFLFFCFFSNLLFAKTRIIYGVYYNDATPLYACLVFSWLFLVFLSFYEVLKFLPTTIGSKRLQTLYVIFGFLTGFIGGASTLIPMFNITMFPFGNITIPIYCIIVTYAILRYHILDLKIAITRVGVFVIVYSIILGIPFWIGLKYYGRGDWLLPTSICAILATVCPFIFLYIQRRAEQSLLQKEMDSHALLEEASYGMTTVKELQKILKLTVNLVVKILNFKKASVFLFDENSGQYKLKASNPEDDTKIIIDRNNPLIERLKKKKIPTIYDELKMNHDGYKEFASKKVMSRMDELSAKAIMPIMMKDDLLGFLVLGDRDSNGIFTRELVGILTILCNQAALAIENASFIEERERDLDKQAQKQRFQMTGEMAVGISHQINNRFHSIIRSTELAVMMYYMYKNKEREDLDLETIAKRLVEGIEKANKYSQGGRVVVDKILEFSKASFDTTEIKFNETLQTAIELVKLKHSKFQYEVETDLPESVILTASEASLQDIIFNALDNSIMSMEMKKQDAQPEDDYKPKISLRGNIIGGKFCLEIEDNGLGIKKENLSKVTNPMFTTKGHNQGTGMGTTIMLRFVQQHGGAMKYESEYGQFCRLKIVLPMSKKKGDNLG